ERRGEVFRLNRNERSHWSGNGVHVESELVFMIGRNMQLNRLLESSLILRGFSRLPTGLFALPLALSMEAHYRERIRSGNPSSAIKL
ncbi:hypothetical protein, partial [Aeromonas caviae]|uniref:hypothetical protein n=1 Tax=Aeromonas caviae TaxID=648 RepID=UPI001CC362CF